jgi:hypothetical protein
MKGWRHHEGVPPFSPLTLVSRVPFSSRSRSLWPVGTLEPWGKEHGEREWPEDHPAPVPEARSFSLPLAVREEGWPGSTWKLGSGLRTITKAVGT